ncbi:MAG TPA: VCBS repeat-containing protein [Cryobacterium sp.]|nr:VCBS repeat-containing protein [Cryobacterium sp.]
MLWSYPGDGAGGWLARSQVGSGWNGMSSILSPGDFNGDARSDVLARDGGGVLWLYPGDGAGGWLARSQVGSGWNGMTSILSPGDFDGDAESDILARDGGGVLWLYPADGLGGWLPRAQVGSGWNGMTTIFGEGSATPTAGKLGRFQSRCYNADGRVLGDFSSLDETWASTNYLRIDHCVTRYGGPSPFTLTEDEAAIAEIASSQLTDPGEPERLYLNIFAACTRIGSEDGPYGFSSIPVPVLEAALSLCPEAPQANMIRDRTGG